jgi:hypothetical protein
MFLFHKPGGSISSYPNKNLSLNSLFCLVASWEVGNYHYEELFNDNGE